MSNREILISYLVKQGQEPLQRPRAEIAFTENEETNRVVNDLERNPHVFLLGYLMDRGIESALAWEIPTRLKNAFRWEGYDFANFAELNEKQLNNVFISLDLHRYPTRMAGVFFRAVNTVTEKFGGNAGNIWNDTPRSATLIRRLLHFEGMRGKFASSMANILFRYFKVPLEDTSHLDITPDSHVRRVFYRMGFINDPASEEEVVYCARELFPEYPGIFDHSCWDLAERVCKRGRPYCDRCELQPYCPKYST
ncbi:MAG: hypothetical protein OEZ59_01530 [Deltaproteobacteria bacterium]|nr:hypothetical protein [Deltaproteobacteria bacterium]